MVLGSGIEPANRGQHDRTAMIRSRGSSGIRIASLLVGVIAVLYLARDILVPLAFAVTLALVLSPAAAWLQKIHIRRFPAGAGGDACMDSGVGRNQLRNLQPIGAGRERSPQWTRKARQVSRELRLTKKMAAYLSEFGIESTLLHPARRLCLCPDGRIPPP
jgi:hypothetical protein